MNHILSLALIAGLMEFLPYIGPVLGAIPALIVAGVDGGTSAFIAVAFLFFGIQWTENNILIPRVMNKTL
jgi:predicted PurR-regulated permease PerM